VTCRAQAKSLRPSREVTDLRPLGRPVWTDPASPWMDAVVEVEVVRFSRRDRQEVEP